MIRKFGEGLVFGAGFGVSFIAIWYLAAYVITPKYFDKVYSSSSTTELSSTREEVPAAIREHINESVQPFHELGIDEQIKMASVIFVTTHETTASGEQKSVISKILKKNPGTIFYYELGDEYPPPGRYGKQEEFYGDGQVVFFVGSPANVRMSMGYSGDRIMSLGDIPMALLEKKCEEGDA